MAHLFERGGSERLEVRKANLNGKLYQCYLSRPSGPLRGTVFLLHGFPDLAITWKNQVPLLTKLGFRVVCPDLMGYGGTNAPKVPPESLSLYGMKRAADDMKELARQLGVSKIIVGGHDWGGALAYRVALHHPDLVSHLFVFCTPYMSPSKRHRTVEEAVKDDLPNFGYQIQLCRPDLEEHVQTKFQIRQFLNAVYGARTEQGEIGFDVSKGVLLDRMPRLRKTRLMSERELDFYVGEYARNGIHGPLNWYRRFWEKSDEESLLDPNTTIRIPSLFFQATKDLALPPQMSQRMTKHFSNMTRKDVEAGHWAHWEKVEEVNAALEDWLNKEVLVRPTKL